MPGETLEVVVEAAMLDAALPDPCFCCLSEKPPVLSFEKSRLFRSLLLDCIEIEEVILPAAVIINEDDVVLAVTMLEWVE